MEQSIHFFIYVEYDINNTHILNGIWYINGDYITTIIILVLD